MKHLKLVVTVAAMLSLAGCSTMKHAKQWDYKVVTGGVPDSLERNFNNAASEGWQVVSASKVGGDGNEAFAANVWNRPRSPDPSQRGS